jgi:hypothetical protein
MGAANLYVVDVCLNRIGSRREFSVVDVVDAIRVFGQPELIETSDKQVDMETLKGQPATDMLVAPLSRDVG